MGTFQKKVKVSIQQEIDIHCSAICYDLSTDITYPNIVQNKNEDFLSLFLSEKANFPTAVMACCAEDILANPSFENTPPVLTENFPNSTLSPSINSETTTTVPNWFLDDGVDFFGPFTIINDATRASVGDYFVYVPNNGGSSPFNRCIGTSMSNNGSPGTCPTTNANRFNINLRYVLRYDYVPFDVNNPSGGANMGTPIIEYSNGSFVSPTLYDENGNILASAEATVAWSDVATSWKTAYSLTSELTYAPEFRAYFSVTQASTTGVLIDNVYVAPLQISAPGISSVTCGTSTNEIAFSLNPTSNMPGASIANYTVTAPAGYTVSPTMAVYNQTTNFILTINSGDFSAGAPVSIDVDLQDEINTNCTVMATIINPCQAVAVSELNLSYTEASCTDNMDGTFTTTYDLTLNWENPPMTGDITLTLTGDGTLNTTTVSAATIAGGNSTTLTSAFTVPADGDGNTGILAVFDDELTCKDSIGFKAPAPCPTEIDVNSTGLFCYQNIAPSGTATQSSTNPGFLANLAIDGFFNILTSTNSETNPFWQVDLGSMQTVDSIIVYRRNTGTAVQQARLENGIVEILDASSTVVFTSVLGTGLPDAILISTGGIMGQTIRVRLEKTEFLQLLEVEVLQKISCTQKRPICEFSTNNNIVGQVWQDFNYNGNNDENEYSVNMAGVQGVQVQLTDCTGNLVGTTYTDGNGNYTFDNTNANEDYRVEFMLPENVACWAKPTHIGQDNGSTVQFVQSGSCASLGIASPLDYCDENPILMTSCFVNGEGLGGTQTGSIDAFVAVPLNFTGNGNAGSDNQYLANMEDVGAVWGVAIQASTRTVFTSSVLKRQVSFGPANNTPGTTQHTTGGIYAIDYSNPAAPTSMLWLDLNAISSISTGADPHTGLNGDPTIANRDPDAFGQVGKMSIGDLEISEDGTKLYAMNLHERTLIEIDIATKAILNQYPIPNTGCTNSDNTIVTALHFRQDLGDLEGKGQTWVNGLAQLVGETGFEDTFLDTNFNPTDAPSPIFRDPATGSNLSLPINVSNGNYEVSLYFRGDEFSPGSRVFDISIEGTLVADDYDITVDNRAKFSYTLLNSSGTSNGESNALHRVANVQKFTTTVSDGVLNVNLDRVIGDDAALAGVKIKSLDIAPNPAPTDHRPWAIGINKGKIYVGSICSGETSELVDDVTAKVLELNGNTFTEVLSFPMNYDRAFASRGPDNNERMARWNAWTSDTTYATLDSRITSTVAFLSYAQPILTGIAFDANDNLLLGITDRLAHQVGYENITPTLDENIIEGAHSAGDLLKACKSGSTWVIEGDAACPQPFSGIANNLAYQGINGGEFFGEDYALVDTSGNNSHDETSWGALTYLPALNQALVVSMDPKGGANSGGLIWYNADDGSYVQGYEVYENTVNTGNAPQLFGKANGLGDIELLCAPAPLEIGNYVWCDSLENGIQDACERGIDDIIVQLYSANGTLVGQDTTSNSGQYYFNQNNVDTTGVTVDGSGIASPITSWSGMNYATQYFIVFGNSQFAASEFNNGSETFGITSMLNAGSNDNIDSDVDASILTTGTLGNRPDGLPFIDMTTSETGCGDHKYDLGVTCSTTYCPTIALVTLNPTEICAEDSTNLMVNFDSIAGNIALYYNTTLLDATTINAAGHGGATFIDSTQTGVVINEVDFIGGEMVELWNTSCETIDVSNWNFCYKFGYNPLNTATISSGDLILSPGERVAFSNLPNITMNNSSGSLGLYRNNSDFGDPANMVDYVQWRGGGQARESVAVSKGIWTAGDFVPQIPVGNTIQYDGYGNNSSDWSFGASTFGSTNVNTDNPLNTIVNTGALVNATTAPMTYYFYGILTDANCNRSTTCQPVAIDSVIVNPIPDITTIDAAICGGTNIYLETLVTNVNNTSPVDTAYFTTLQNAIDSTNALVSLVSPSTDTTYYVRLSTNSNPSCYDIDSLTITVNNINSTISTTCDDNGTSNNVNDDTFTITVNASNASSGASGQCLVIYNGTILNGSGTTYGTDIIIMHADFVANGSFSPTLIIRDVDDTACEIMTTVAAVANCSICPPQICLPIKMTRKVSSGTN